MARPKGLATSGKRCFSSYAATSHSKIKLSFYFRHLVLVVELWQEEGFSSQNHYKIIFVKISVNSW